MRVYIGWDKREPHAALVAASSLRRHSSASLEIIELKLTHPHVRRRYWRQFTTEHGQRFDSVDGKHFSTDFSFSRFLIPSIQGYRGWCVFCDCDFLFRGDIAELADIIDDKYAVMVVKHDHKPKNVKKMDGMVQASYDRKNWSSFVLWNCGHPAHRGKITPVEVNEMPGSWLHTFAWLKDEEIGEIPEEWNWLVNISPTTKAPKDTDPKGVHFTEGGPWFEEYREVPYADEWWEELRDYRS